MAMEDVVEILAVDLIGVVPDDEQIVVTTNKGEPASAEGSSMAGRAFKNIAARVLGQDVPFLDLNTNNNFMGKLKKVFGFSN